MTIRVAINGFGRIGSLTARALLQSARTDIELVAINGTGTPEQQALLLAYDSVHGQMAANVDYDDHSLLVDGKRIPVSIGRDPAKIDWAQHDVDVVMECSGQFRDREGAGLHLTAGAKKVLISSPAKSPDRTIVYGVNHNELRAEDLIVSNASCTTNCLAPVTMVLDAAVGIERGFMTTIHAYTGDQKLVDAKHSDPRRSRAAALSIIPTSTGAAKALGEVLPGMKGKLDGSSVRVPTPNVSMVDLVFDSAKPTSETEINDAISAAAETPALKGILTTNRLPLVSSDFCTNPSSSVFDLTQTQVIKDKLVRVVAWYDNEWGFSCRMIDTAIAMMKA